ncbi:MAG: cache domain-containing protein [bacterium]
MKIHSIKFQIMIVITLLILFLITGSSYYIYNQTEDLLYQTLIKEAEKTTKQYTENITQWLEKNMNLINTLTEMNQVQGMNWLSSQIIFNRILEETEMDAIMMVSTDGKYKTTAGEIGDISDKAYFQEVIKNKRPVISKPYIDSFTGLRMLVIAYPITDDYDKIVGVLGGIVQMSYIDELVDEIELNNSGYGWIINSNKTVITHPDQETHDNKIDSMEDSQYIEEVINFMVQGQEGKLNYIRNNTEYIALFSPIKYTDWSLAVTAETDNVLSSLSVLKKGIIYSALIAVIIGLLATYFITIRISSPIISLTKFVKKISSGDLSTDINVDSIKLNNEIKTL